VSKLLIGIMMVVTAIACTPDDPKFRQYMVEGERLYIQHCSNCHQRDGKGLRRVYPPLAGSDYLQNNLSSVICSMKYGLQGEINVQGVKYNQAMPGVPSLTELELAEIATYIYNSWGGQHERIDPRRIGPILDSCARPKLRR
jgi:mono/diheme cytochrome c family protein